MVSVYLIKSVNNNWFYVGISKNVIQRLISHNSGKQKATKFYKPFQIVYTKEFDNYKAAREYEKLIKIRSNKEKLIKSLISSN